MKYGLIIGLLISVLIGVFITFYALRSNLKTNSQNRSENGTNNESQESPINQAHRAKATTDLKSVETSLEIYRSQNQKYPDTNSYSTMIFELKNKNIMSSIPEESNKDYSYKYCSSNGLNFLLQAKYKNEIITSFGADKCTSGE